MDPLGVQATTEVPAPHEVDVTVLVVPDPDPAEVVSLQPANNIALVVSTMAITFLVRNGSPPNGQLIMRMLTVFTEGSNAPPQKFVRPRRRPLVQRSPTPIA